MTKKKLTDKQKAFVEEYLVDLCAKQAAIRAGYSKKTSEWIGPQLLKKSHVAAQIAIGIDERTKRTKIDADYVLRQAVKLHERCMQESEPVMSKDGDQEQEGGKAVYKFNAAGAAKGLELVGKHVDVQAFREQTALTDGDGKPLDLSIPLNIVFIPAAKKAHLDSSGGDGADE